MNANAITATLPAVSPAHQRAARILAKSAYLRSPFNRARSHDWQDAEVAACSYLQERAGLSNDEAYEVGRELAGEVVRELETADADDGREF